jgi:tetratricopeptide (TPR) repeat protein
MSGGSMGEWKARILHISDLHERGPRERESFRRRRVLGEAWKRNLDALLEDGPIDLVCFTGDIADWGRPEEYGAATEFIESLLQQLSLSIDRLFLVPGNHDIDRGKGQNAWAELRGGKDTKSKLFRVPRLDLSRWMAGGEPPLGLESLSRDELLSRQGAYREWVSTKLGRKELLPAEKAPHPFLGYRHTLRLPGHPFDIHVVGLDSAWLAGDDNDSGKLFLTTDQVGRLATNIGESLSGFRLALVHHPLSELADKDDCQRLLADHVDLLLRGHLHDEAIDTWADPDRTSRQLAAGCLYEGHHADEWPNACHVMTATLDVQGRPLRYDLRFRSWARRGHWYDDNGHYEGSKDGRLTWWIQQGPPPPSLNPIGVFVGRAPELEKLKAALLPVERRPVAICAVHGMPGVGKSYLAARFAELYSEHFPGGCARLVLNPTALPSVEVLLGELGNQLELPAGARMAERCRERLLRPLSLLIVENVDSKEAAGVAARLAQVLSGCPLLVTGRWRDFSEAGGWKRVEVQTLDEATALQLLQQELGEESRVSRTQAQTLVRALGHLPLAVHLAAGYLRASHSVESFLALLKRKGLGLEPADSNDPLFMVEQARSIIKSTFELSLELLRRHLGTKAEDQPLLSGLTALGHAPLSGFGESLGAAIAGLTKEEFRELAASATPLSLLARVPRQERQDDAWRIHPLLTELLRARPGAASGLERMTQWFVDRLPKLPFGQEQLQGERWKEVHREGNALVDWLLQVPENDHVQVERAGSWFAIHQGPFPAWVEFCERALKGSLNPEERSNFLWTLGNVAKNSGALDRALAAAEEKSALDRERQDPRESAQAAGIRAAILQSQGELDEALRIRQQEQLPVYERLGDVHTRAMTLGKMADILQTRGELDEALRIRQQEEIPVYERLGDVYARAVTLGKVADILQARGELDEALRIRQQEEIPVYERLGNVHARAVTLGQVADILQARGQLDEALRIHQQEEIPVYERLGDVYARAVALGKVAEILESRGELDEALRIRQQEQLPVFERLGNVQARAVTLGQVADILQARGQLDEALRIRQQEEIPVYERLGNVSARAMTLRKVANILQTRGELDEALRILRQEVQPAFERLGDVYSRAVTLGEVADILQARGELDEALRIRQQEELPIYERLGDVHARAVTLGQVAEILQVRGELDEALRIRQQEQLPVYERLGDVYSRAVTLGTVAAILQTRGELDEALRIRQQEELPTYERLGDLHARAVTLWWIATLFLEQGKLDPALRLLKAEVLPVFKRLGDVGAHAGALACMASVLQKQGELDQALRILKAEVLPVFERLGDVHEQAVSLRRVAAILQDQGELEEALHLLREQVLPVFNRLGAVKNQALALRQVASILHEQGESDEALRILHEQVLPVFERMGATRERETTLEGVARIRADM